VSQTTDFERGRIAGLRQAINYHERAISEQWRVQSDAQSRFDRDAYELSGGAEAIHNEAVMHLEGAVSNPDYFARASA
jgi:hypothetical protein